jgi:hypothetical protein
VTLNSAWSVKDDNHFAAGFAGLHHTMRLADLLEPEHA